jgi:hypothetical protein
MIAADDSGSTLGMHSTRLVMPARLEGTGMVRARIVVMVLRCCLVSITGLVACSEDDPSGQQLTCAGDSPPIHLASQLDDDDGDGNPLDEDFPTINDEDDDIADHAWIVDASGVRHLFFQNEGHDGSNDIEHYTTTDLQNLEYQGVALSPSAGGWDSRGIWAPHIVNVGDTYFMFYTGVNGIDAGSQQRIGLATSTDLSNWTRVPASEGIQVTGDGAIYECEQTWTTWGSGANYDDQCRDPFVIWDDSNQRWVMLATARSTNGFGVVTAAYSPNLTDWTGAGYINATRRLAQGNGAQKTGGGAENPFVMVRDNTFYLLFTDWKDPEDDSTSKAPRTIVQYATSASLLVTDDGSPHWTYRGNTPNPGVNAIEVQKLGASTWLMSQSISNEASGTVELRRTLRLMCVSFQGDFGFATTAFHCSDHTNKTAAPTAPIP